MGASWLRTGEGFCSMCHDVCFIPSSCCHVSIIPHDHAPRGTGTD